MNNINYGVVVGPGSNNPISPSIMNKDFGIGDVITANNANSFINNKQKTSSSNFWIYLVVFFIVVAALGIALFIYFSKDEDNEEDELESNN
ncbi:MAG: hypothetical protein CMF62_02225 [Magnetococcales bacterium]|nr:hypothetical protein [Magnetococcales bacterium]|tara:strand:- start:5327 stop:5599 length:273 start_codon:yes stop_codon:yes gene_type:complete